MFNMRAYLRLKDQGRVQMDGKEKVNDAVASTKVVDDALVVTFKEHDPHTGEFVKETTLSVSYPELHTMKKRSEADLKEMLERVALKQAEIQGINVAIADFVELHAKAAESKSE